MTAFSPTAAQPVSPPPQPGDPAPGDAPDPGPGRSRRPETPAGPSLSPSRAADFKTCPLLFRFRTVDKLPETPSADQVRGTLVHAVLERLFDLPAAERTPESAAALVAPEWDRLITAEPALAVLFNGEPPAQDRPAPAPRRADSGAMRDPAAVEAEIDATGQAALIDVPAGEEEAARIAAFLAGATDLLAGYFAVEDPRRLQPAERETLISTTIGDELLLRGYIDRLDVSPAGDLRVVDYKTGGAPREAFEGRALFQLKFYALVLWRARGVVPRALRLLYLKDAEALDYSPDPGELERFERTLIALSHAIERAKRDRDFRPKPSRLCGWCSHQSLCPEFGGTPPPFPESAPAVDVTADQEPDRVGTVLRDGPLG
ncbi:PD-(D/E)XK nuclease family protein [Actinoplanes sp. NEAU-A12]|uniref:PD-(D/E)XK nuclease family protein n=1 Tax=Actinoplanes sandaracinus TaxID=3045177 RepID=A0ABT6WKC6_9ACTN|nr:PD-(D/E)XK nuclease family protein [Actinoplanes sandaracinus]MDI6100141.1 PD-(D/E)XK nuclease family protein [Actinoplanes sandaracinus]